MSLLLWEYFWNAADWLPPPIPPRESIGGGSRGSGYSPLTEDYWETRAAHLKTPAPKPKPIVSDNERSILDSIKAERYALFQEFIREANYLGLLEQQLAQIEQLRNATLAKLRTAASLAAMEQASSALDPIEATLAERESEHRTQVIKVAALKKSLQHA
jgi:hypothetical protein